MPRGYSPRWSTIHLMADIKRQPGIESVRVIPPSRSDRRTRLRVTLEDRDPHGEPVYTDFTLPEARAWLASEHEEADDAQR